jgi:hypothetical protein
MVKRNASEKPRRLQQLETECAATLWLDLRAKRSTDSGRESDAKNNILQIKASTSDWIPMLKQVESAKRASEGSLEISRKNAFLKRLKDGENEKLPAIESRSEAATQRRSIETPVMRQE